MAVEMVREEELEREDRPDGSVAWTTPAFRPSLPARRVVPFWNVVREREGPPVRAELKLTIRRDETPWMMVAGRGLAASDAELGPFPAGISLDGDELALDKGTLQAARLRVVCAPGLPAPSRAGVAFWPVFDAVALPQRPVKPAFTEGRIAQHAQHPELGRHICGPSSLAMALGHFGHPVGAVDLALEVRDAWSELHGHWTNLAAAAGERGLVAFVERGGGPARLAEHLARGRLAILSLRWEDGELVGSAIPRSAGHLVLAVGADRDAGLFMDPAFKDPEIQVVRYDWQSVLRSWKSGAMVVVGRS